MNYQQMAMAQQSAEEAKFRNQILAELMRMTKAFEDLKAVLDEQPKKPKAKE